MRVGGGVDGARGWSDVGCGRGMMVAWDGWHGIGEEWYSWSVYVVEQRNGRVEGNWKHGSWSRKTGCDVMVDMHKVCGRRRSSKWKLVKSTVHIKRHV